MDTTYMQIIQKQPLLLLILFTVAKKAYKLGNSKTTFVTVNRCRFNHRIYKRAIQKQPLLLLINFDITMLMAFYSIQKQPLLLLI